MAAPTTQAVAAFSPASTGGVLIAPIATALPTDATTALAGTYVALGYVSDEGVQDASDAASSDDIFAWGGDNIATLQSTGSVQRYSLKLAGWYDADAAKFLYGTSNVTVTAPTGGVGTKLAILDKGDEIAPCRVVFEMKYKTKKARIVIPNAIPVVTGRDPLVHTGIAAAELTVTCLKDASGNRQYIYLVNDDA